MAEVTLAADTVARLSGAPLQGTDILRIVRGTTSYKGTMADVATYVVSNLGSNVAVTSIELGHASDTTITRASAGRIAVEGSNVLMASDLGVTVQAYDADVAALAANSTNGLWGRTGAGTGAARTITGTANEITSTNGDGVSGNPTLSLPSALTFTGKTITGGTFSGPTLSGTVAGTPTIASAWTWSATQSFLGTATNDNASTGYLGEYVSSSIAQGSAVSVTSATATNITSISLTAGDWDVEGNIWFNPASGTVPTSLIAAINTTSATLPTSPGGGAYSVLQVTLPASTQQGIPTGMRRISLAATTTVYLIAQTSFTVSTMTAHGFIGARRRR